MHERHPWEKMPMKPARNTGEMKDDIEHFDRKKELARRHQ